MGQVARLTVPSLADLCVIDLLADDGSISDVAVAGAEGPVAAELENLRARHPLDPDGAHPVARVIRSGDPELLPRMTERLLRSFAEGSEHARFMIDHDYRSAVVAPLLARKRTLGALSVLRFGERPPYGSEELELVCELARRAALAIDNARLFSDLKRLRQHQDAVLANLAEAITVEDESGQTVFANQAAADLVQVASPEELTNAAPGTMALRFLILDEDGREIDLAQMPGRRLFRDEPAEPLLVRNIVRATGEERWLNVRASAITAPDTRRVVFAVNVFENITEVKRAQLAESFMAQASRVLASSMDYAETLQRVARLAVPAIADWCAVDLLDESGDLENVAVHHANPEKIALARQLQRLYRPEPARPTGVHEVIRTGRPQIFTDIRPEVLAARARDAQHLELLQAIGARAAVIVPLVSAVKTIGAITLVSSESARRLTSADVGLAERLGRRAGTAVENARLYTERTRIAHVLQKALLPESLPDVPGAETAASYRAAGELNEVGGDFYDVFEHGAGRWMLVIGDVVGKGPRAAGVTALARHTLRAASMTSKSPKVMLEMLHRALRRQPPGADLCTVCLVAMAPASEGMRVTVALAGHPPPLLFGTGGRVTPLGRPGTLLGVLDPIEIRESEFELRAGQTLLLYTDGVLDAGPVENRLGEHGLIELCRRGPALTLGALLEQIEQTALTRAGGRPRDDLALLAVRLSHQAPLPR